MTWKDKILKEWDFSALPSPVYVLHEGLLAGNMKVIDEVREKAGVEVIVGPESLCDVECLFPN